MENIELVIKIPEEKYDVIKSDLYNTLPAEMKEWGLEAIRNGTLLPKGHGDLIDIKELEEKIWDVDCRCGYVQVVDMDDILDANIVIPEDKESEE